MKKIALIIGILIAFLLCGIVSAELGSDGREYDLTAASVRSSGVLIAAPQQQGNCNILWDTTHGEGLGAGIAYYGELVSDLQSKGCTVTPSGAGVDTPGLLSQYDVLVINAGSSTNSAYTASEVDAIENFVNNGNGLLVMDEYLDWSPAPNLEPVVARFGTHDTGTIITWDQITNFDTTHPIFSGISSIQLFATGILSAQSPSTAVAWDGNNPVVNVVTGKKVVIIGDGNIFQSDPASTNFIDQYDNRKFASNVFTYLCPKENQVIPSIPEFPSIFLPVTTIIGFLGAVLLIQRTREN